MAKLIRCTSLQELKQEIQNIRTPLLLIFPATCYSTEIVEQINQQALKNNLTAIPSPPLEVKTGQEEYKVEFHKIEY